MDEACKTDLPVEPAAENAAHGFSWYLRWPMAILALYCLSTGPALKFIELHPNVDFSMVYFPIDWLQDHSVICDEAFNWYIHSLWGVGVPASAY